MKTYTDEYKKAAVERVKAGEKRIDVAKDLKITASLITSWRDKIEGKKKSAAQSSNGKKNGHYPPALRAKALKLLASGMSSAKIAERLKVTAAIVHYWKKAEVAGGSLAEKLDGTVVKQKANGKAHVVDQRDVRDSMVFFNKALKIASKRGTEAFHDEVILNLAYGVSLLEKKV